MSRWAKILASPRWRVADLLKMPSNDSDLTPDRLQHLAKLAGLTSVSPEAKKDLSQQISFLNSLSDYNTEGFEPLCRLAEPQVLTLDETSGPVFEEWEPLSLTKRSVGPYYVVDINKDYSKM